jgi:hypothetical protein
MQGKITEVLRKREELSIDGKVYDAKAVWEFVQYYKEGDIVEYNVGSANTSALTFCKKQGRAETSTSPMYRKKGSFYVEKNDDLILRENVLRTAVMFAEQLRNEGAKINLEGLFGIAKIMEEKIRNGFDKAIE